MRRLDLDGMRKMSLQAIMDKISVQKYLDNTRECIGLPTLLLDQTINAIAFSFEFPFFNAWWEMAARREITSSEVLNNKEHFYVWQNQCSKNILIAPSAPGGKDPTVIGPVISNGKLYATCGIMLRDANTEDAVEAFKIYSHTIATILGFNESISELRARVRLAEDILLSGSWKLLNHSYPGNYAYGVCRTQTDGIAELQYCQQALNRIGQPNGIARTGYALANQDSAQEEPPCIQNI